MASVDDFSPPSTSIKAEDLDGADVTLTIMGYTVKEFDEKDHQTGEAYKRKKPIFSFEETDQTFVCNLTNMKAMADAFKSKDLDEWIGKKITLFPTVTSFGDKTVPCIRVRVPNLAGKPKFLKNGPRDDHPFAPGND